MAEMATIVQDRELPGCIRAAAGILLVHSFSTKNASFQDYARFLELFHVEARQGVSSGFKPTRQFLFSRLGSPGIVNF